MAQQKYYAAHRFVFVGGDFWGECIEWPDFSRDPLTADVATDGRFIFPIKTGMTKLEPYEFTFNKTKDINSTHRKAEAWNAAGDDRQVTVIETDAQGDPFDPKSVVGEFDLGQSQCGTPSYPGGSKESPAPGKVKVKIMARQLKYRDLTA